MLRRTLLAAAAVVAMMAAAPKAEAVVTYTLINQRNTFTDPSISQPDRLFNVSFTVSDAAVSRGGINVGIFGGAESDPRPPTVTGDAADFVSATFLIDTITPSFAVGTLLFNVSFAPTGEVSSALIDLRGRATDATLTGTSALFGGRFGSEGYTSCSLISQTQTCSVSGQLVSSVPEPMSLALLGMGLLGMAVVRRRSA